MVRNYKRKTDWTEKSKKAVKNGQTIRQAAHNYGINESSLWRAVRNVSAGKSLVSLSEASQSRIIFFLEEEAVLVEYLLKASRIGFPLDTSTLKSLAYDLAIRNSKRSWRTQKSAGKDWLKGFKSRHSQLSIRTPEPTSIARATAFNKTNVGPFFDKLKQLYEELSLTPERIYNVDETGGS
ncbi:transposase [Plakobranchus ocellatus]|uniref:Transposase n=1 Tax=Plakobranchus ocellatus TaxID=259542 RepID=A0AAV3YAL9_9GAST|nr:transposase [Plakobranchus ocellatus]